MTSSRKNKMGLLFLVLFVLAWIGTGTTRSVRTAENDSSDETSDIDSDYDSMIG